MRSPAVLLALTAIFTPPAHAQDATTERWRCTLEVEAGIELPFQLEVTGGEAFLLNPPERLPVAEYERSGDTVRIGFPHFDSVIEATAGDDGSYAGTWRKQRRRTEVATVPFRMEPVDALRFEPVNGLSVLPSVVAGRWRVDFETSESDSIGLFETPDNNELRGTFMTRTGDYRFLAGDVASSRTSTGMVRLSCFDGAHAFLFHAELDAEGRLDGTFWSGNWWREGWTAVRDDGFELPHAFEELELLPTAAVDEALVLTTDGDERTLGQVIADAYPTAPRATLVQILGTWCPNCYDETEYLKELHATYGDRGLAIVGLCFELSGDATRDRAQIARFAATREVPYPLVFAGEADKPAAAAALGLVDRVLSFPTTIFVDGAGRARQVHSGFNGPATGAAHVELRREFTESIDALLAEDHADDLWSWLSAEPWFDHGAFAGATWTFARDERGQPRADVELHGSGVRTVGREQHPVRLSGSSVLVGDEPWIADRAAGVLRRAGQPLRRLARSTVAPNVLTDETPNERLLALLDHDDALARREALAALGFRLRWTDGLELPDLSAWIDDADPAVRRAAAELAGRARQAVAVDALARALGASDPRLRALAARALTGFEELPGEVAQALVERRSADAFPSVRELSATD